MKPTRRGVVAAAGLLLAGLGALVFAGGQVGACLGPLGVTPIQCAKATGIVPMVGPGLPLSTLAVTLGVLALIPIRRDRWRGATIASGLAGGVAAAVFAAAWERTWTGVDSAGRALSVDRPLDLGAVATVAILAGAVAGLGWTFLVAPIRARLMTRS